MSALVFEGFLSTPEMLAVFEPPSVIQAMLDFEAALARAQAAEGLIPPAAAEGIGAACKAERFDVQAIVAASGRAGSLAIPLVKKLTEAVAKTAPEAAGHVHIGSTSQDVIDTGMVLLTRRALALLDRDLGDLVDALLALAERHGQAPLLARTLMQPAVVTSFGFKLAGWIAPLVRAQQRIRRAARAALKLQLGGAVGTLSVMGERGDAVMQRVAADLQLEPAPSWHTQRDEIVALGCEIGVLAGSLGKVARDLALQSQGEIGELAEPSGAGRGGSSAMPHKRNPVAAMVALAGAQRAPHRVAALLAAMPQEHERGLGNWQAELAEWSGLLISTHGALKALAETAPGLAVDEARMRANIDALHGLVFAEAAGVQLAQRIGKARAHALLEGLSQRVVADKRSLADLLREAVASDRDLQGVADEATIARLFDPGHAARAARTRAQALLASLREQAGQLRAAPPWSAWLPFARSHTD